MMDRLAREFLMRAERAFAQFEWQEVDTDAEGDETVAA